MKCLLIFDHLNDIIYAKYSRKFAVHINEFAKEQRLIDEEVNFSRNVRFSHKFL